MIIHSIINNKIIIKYENLSDYGNLWMIINIGVYPFVNPYKREIPLMKIYFVLFLYLILLFFEYFLFFLLFFLLLILLFYNMLTTRHSKYIENEKNAQDKYIYIYRYVT